ncbi:MAG: hypothetical protein Q9217_001191 [Psora testacea]
MSLPRQVIAVAGVGDLGRYICEELLASPVFDVVVLTRSDDHLWCASHNIPTHNTDYTVPSIVSILDNTQATTLISFINLATPAYVSVHTSLLQACQQSHSCKRLIPSEWIGDSETFPLKPNYYATTREPFRQTLKQQQEIEWTLFNPGWLADYFLPVGKSYMKPIPQEFPVDPEGWSACVRGTGEEVQSWTMGRDVGKAVVELCKAENWAEIQHVLETRAADDPISAESELAQVEELMVKGCMSCPKEKTLRQRKKYFAGIKFRSLEELLKDAECMDFL